MHFEMESESVNVGLPLPSLHGTVRDGKYSLYWKELSGASAYYLYRRDYDGSGWGNWGLKYRGAETEWTDETAAYGGKYEYRLRAMTGKTLGGYSNSVILGPNLFEDVKESKWYYEAILWAYYHEPQITAGKDGTHFAPNETCTRAQVMTFLWHAENDPAPADAANPFTDVKAGKYYYDAILWAYSHKPQITGSATATTFGVSKPCTRAQAVTFLWKAHGAPEPQTAENPFTDVNPEKYYY